jgi:HrpA-like RNA helicase
MHLRIRRKRPSLRLIVSSATIDAVAFLEYFRVDVNSDEVTVASLEGRMYPVETAYLQMPTADYVRKAAEVTCMINTKVSWCTLFVSSCDVDTYIVRYWRCPYLPYRCALATHSKQDLHSLLGK